MKNSLISRIAAFAAVLLAAGCQPELVEEERYLRLSSPSESVMAVPAEGGTVELAVSTNLSWIVSASDASGASVRWISFDSASGSGDATVEVTVARNISADRSAVVTIVSQDRKMRAEITLRQAPGTGSADAEGYEMPAYDVIENVSNMDITAGAANGAVDGTRFVFDNGASLTKTGTETSPEFTWTGNNYYASGVLFRGWTGEDEAVVLQIPMKTGLCGNYRIAWGWHSSAAAKWSIFYSNDGETYVDTGKTLSTSTTNRFQRDVFFTIDEAHPVAPGESLYLKMVLQQPLAENATVTFCNAFLLTGEYPDETQLPSGEKVLYACNFDKVNEGVPYELPLGYMRSIATAFTPASFGYDGMSKTGTVVSEWGAVRIGSSSAVASLTFPALEGIGEGTADLKVSFRAVLYQAATILSETEGKASCNIEVSVAEGAGTVENGAITDLANWTSFEERSVTVKGAGKDTRIKIGISGGSGDRRFYLDDVVIEATTDIVVPDVVTRQLADVLAGGDGTISSSWKTAATVVSDPASANCPENTVYVMDGNACAAIVTESAAGLKTGDKAVFMLKGARVSGKVITLAESAEVTSEAGSLPSAKSIGISELAGNEYALVEIKGVQASDAFVGKTFGSGITMENAAKVTFALGMFSRASFAAETVPAGSGSVRGIAIGGKLYPRNRADISLDGDRLGGGEAKPAFKTVINTFDNQPEDPASTTATNVVNGKLEDNVFTFAGGASVELIGGGDSRMTFAQAKNSPYNIYLTSSGWTAGNTFYRLSAPVEEEISGSVMLTFAVNGSKIAGQKFDVSWSNDGENWIPAEYIWTVDAAEEISTSSFAAQSTIAKGITRARFSVPSDNKVNAGGKIWFRIASQEDLGTDPVQLGFGFVVAPGEIANTPEPAGAILFNNFSDCVAGSDYMAGADMRAFGNVGCPEWSKAGWDAVKVNTRYGYVFCGGSNNIDQKITTPALVSLAGTEDIVLTFKSCLYMPSTTIGARDAIAVTVEGAGTVGAVEWGTPLESDYYSWHTATVRIKGADSSTRVSIGIDQSMPKSDYRMFIDDILITK
ncbi:MAG: hypothetical protein K2J62_03605 [Bacteroidales bacterium]|nr:hypothetical protein [Bacteroidales bacterium]